MADNVGGLPWPKTVAQIQWDGQANEQFIPAELARELYEALKAANDKAEWSAVPPASKRDLRATAEHAIARYEHEVETVAPDSRDERTG